MIKIKLNLHLKTYLYALVLIIPCSFLLSLFFPYPIPMVGEIGPFLSIATQKTVSAYAPSLLSNILSLLLSWLFYLLIGGVILLGFFYLMISTFLQQTKITRVNEVTIAILSSFFYCLLLIYFDSIIGPW